MTAVIIAGALTVSAIVPEVDYEPDRYSIDNVKVGKYFTEVQVTFQGRPGSWVRLSSNTFLRDCGTKSEFPLIKADGFPLDSQVVMDRTGHRKAKLFFETVPKNVRTVDMIEAGSDAASQSYGIHLDRKRRPRQMDVKPTVEDIYNRTGEPEPWTPPTGKRFYDEQLAVQGGNVHFKGKVDNFVPAIGSTVMLFNLNNELGGNDPTVSAQLDSVGNFEVDLPVDYAQQFFFTLGGFRSRVFAVPGDTINYQVSTKSLMTINQDGSASFAPEYEYIESNTRETTEVNLLRYALADSLKDLETDYIVLANEISGWNHDKMLEFGENMKSKTREALSRLTRLLTPLNISPKSKDYLFTKLLVDIYEPMMYAEMDYRYNMFIKTTDEDGNTKTSLNPDFVALDTKKYYGGQKDFIGYLWDNPYVLSTTGSFINRIEYGNCRENLKYIVIATENTVILSSDFTTVTKMDDEQAKYKSRRDYIENFIKEQEASYGSGNDFMTQLIITKSVLGVVRGTEPTSEALGRVSKLSADVMRLVDYSTLQEYYLSALNDLAARVAMNENKIATDNAAKQIGLKSEVLASVVAPFKDRVVYVDVWDIGCGPCRASMIRHKEIIEKYKDSPVTFIYIAPERNREACEQFMAKNDVKGEHIFLSDDYDARFKADFDIQGIPFEILIGKNGEFTTDVPCQLEMAIESELAK